MSHPSFGQSNIEYYSQLQEKLKTARETKDYANLAEVYERLGTYESKYDRTKNNVLDYFGRAIDYYKLLDNQERLHIVKTKMAIEYINSALPDNARILLNETKEYYATVKDTSNLIESIVKLSELDLVSNNFTRLEEGMGQLGSLILSSEPASVSLLKCKIKIKLGQPEEALAILKTKLLLNLSSLSILQRFETHLLHAETNLSQNRYKLGIDNIEMAQNLVPNLPFNAEQLKIYDFKKRLFSQESVYDSAYVYSEKAALLRDSILDRSRLESISNLSERYKSKEKNTAIKVLELEKKYAQETNEQQTRALSVLGLLLGVLMFLIYFTVRFYTQQIDANEIITAQKEELSSQKIQTLQDDIKLKSMHSMIEGQENERERVSKDLHDSLGGLLSSIKLQIEHIPIDVHNLPALEKQEKIMDLLDSAVVEVRNISSNLQPTSLANLGLIPALKDLFNRVDADEYPDVEFQHYDVPMLNNMVGLSIYRIVQELLNNTIKHAQASEVFIQLRKENDELVLQYEDDGIGFDVEKLKIKGMGLENITSRVNYLHGEMSIDARVGSGVSYVFHFDI